MSQQQNNESVQAAWQKLLDEALKEPGVADVLRLQQDAPDVLFGAMPVDPPINYWVSENWHA